MIKQISGGVCAARGFQASGVHCGIRKSRTKKDLALIYSTVPAHAAAVYTTNLVMLTDLLRPSSVTAAMPIHATQTVLRLLRR